MASFLLQRGEVFYFRRVVPFDLRPYFPVKEIWLSLRTTGKLAAKAEARRLSGVFEKLALKIRSGTMTETEIRQLVRRHFSQGVKGLEDSWTKPSTFYSPEKVSDLTENIDMFLIRLRNMHAQQRHNDPFVINGVESMLSGSGVHMDRETPEYHRLCREFLRGLIAFFERLAREKRGETIDYPPILGIDDTLNQSPTEISAVPPKPAPVPLSVAIETYEKQLALTKEIDRVTMGEYAQAYRLLPGVIGDKPIGDVTRDDVRAVLSALKRMPVHANKKALTRGKTPLEAIEIADKNNLDRIGPAAIEKKFQRIKGLLTWAYQEGLTDRNIVDGINYRKGDIDDRRPDEEQPAYTAEDIRSLVNGLIAERAKGTFEKHPERYWLPLIALFTGCRTEEIAQLHIEDMIDRNGITCFNITTLLDEDGIKIKRVKRKASRRAIPVHPLLIGLGLLDYIDDEVLKKGKPRLWMALNRQSNGKFRRNFSDWYNGTDNTKGFENIYVDDDKAKSFYSIRHSFATALKHLLVDERIATELLGQAQTTLASGTYGKVFPPEMLLEALKKVDYDVDFIGYLGRWPWTDYIEPQILFGGGVQG